MQATYIAPPQKKRKEKQDADTSKGETDNSDAGQRGVAKQGDTEADLGIRCQPCRKREMGEQPRAQAPTPSCLFDHDGITADTLYT